MKLRRFQSQLVDANSEFKEIQADDDSAQRYEYGSPNSSYPNRSTT